MKRLDYLRAPAVAMLLLVLAAVGRPADASQASAAAAPTGKTYYVVTLGLSPSTERAYQMGSTCLSFSERQVCEMDGACGSWWQLPDEPRMPQLSQFGFEFSVIDEGTGQPLTLRGVGRIDGRGTKSSLGAVAHGFEPSSATQINFSIAGRAVRSARCERLIAEFLATHSGRRVP